jgi:hypothetical protein
MRIISKFKDYYDLGLSQGADDRLVMVRHTEQYQTGDLPRWVTAKVRPPKEMTKELAAFVNVVKSYQGELLRGTDYQATKNHGELRIEAAAIVFCGKYYVVFRASRKRLEFPGNSDVTHHYDLQSLNSLVLEQEGKDLFIERKERWHNNKWSWPLWVHKQAMAVRDLSAEATLAKTPILLNDAAQWVTVNPRLADYEFAKAVDPWQAFQELSMFMGNIAAPDNCPVNIADKDRVYQHGFDMQYGFRTRPKE